MPERRSGDALDRPASAFVLARTVLRAGDPQRALAETAARCAAWSRGVAAAWIADPDRGRLSLAAVEGATPALARGITNAFPVVRPDARGGWKGTGQALTTVAGATSWTALDADVALVLTCPSLPISKREQRDLSAWLRDVLSGLAEISRARKRNEELDLGIALTAHEIRGPALSASAAIEAALRNEHDPGEARMLLQRSAGELRALGGAVEAMLRWSVGEAGVRRRPTDLVSVVREAVAQSRNGGEGLSNVRLLAPSRLTIRADRQHLRTALANVVRNAVSFSPRGQDVLVQVNRHNGTASVVVEDAGPGVAPEEREAIFDPFVRGQSTLRTRSGNGLGLFIAKRVVQAHRGSIWLESGSRGARFHIELPVH